MAPIIALLERAHVYLDQGQYRQAAKALRQILHKNPNHVESLDLLSKIALKKHNYSVALGLITRAIKIWPRNAILFKNLGKSYCGLRDWPQAITALETSLTLDNRQPEAHYFLGLALKNTGELNQAGHSFQKAYGLKPDYVGAYYRMADTLAEAKMFNAAVQFYQRAHDLAPDRTDILVDLGNALRKCNDDLSAETCYRRALELNPKSISALNNWGNLLRDQGNAALALKLAQKAIAIRPKLPVLQNGLGLAYEQTKDWDKARVCYQLAMELDPNYDNPRLNLAKLEQTCRNLSQAQIEYQ
jgi:tetratricopeptide (TPR) repeat protein